MSNDILKQRTGQDAILSLAVSDQNMLKLGITEYKWTSKLYRSTVDSLYIIPNLDQS